VKDKIMADIELVIDIPEETYIYLRNGGTIGASLMIENAIKNGTPLPKGHGALIDISNIDVIELEDSSHFIRHEKDDEVDVYISAPAIIEADRGSEDKE
jgi:hypothetical protein